MKLLFDREILVVNGLPILGKIEVEVDGELDRSGGLFHGSWLMDLAVTGFEPEDSGTGLNWASVEAPVEEWLAANSEKIKQMALENAAP